MDNRGGPRKMSLGSDASRLPLPVFLIVKLSEALSGRRFTEIVADMFGVTERTVKNGGPKHAYLPPNGGLPPRILRKNAERLELRGFTRAEAARFAEQAPANTTPGAIWSDLIYYQQGRGAVKYPQTIEFSKGVEKVFQNVAVAIQNAELEHAKRLILESTALSPVSSFIEQDTNSKRSKFFSRAVSEANTADQLNQLVTELYFHALLAVMVKWDIEFTSIFFERMQLRSTFAMVMPGVKPSARIEPGTRHKKSPFLLPVARLLDLMGCLGWAVRYERMPDVPPDAATTVAELEMGGLSVDVLSNWRTGETPLTMDNFIEVWDYWCEQPGNRITGFAPPAPVIVAAFFWDVLFVKRVKRSVSELFLVEGDYVRWWRHLAKEKLAKGDDGDPWPEFFMYD